MAGTLPLVTVAIPAFNAAKTLPETLRSVLAQNYRQLEIIVSDNHSSDETVKLVQREFAGQGVRVVTCPVAPRKGSYADTIPVIDNLNSLLGLGSGKYLAIYHADDVYDRGIVEREVEVLERDPEVGAVFTEGRAIDAVGRRIHATPPRLPGTESVTKLGLQELVEAVILHGSIVMTPTFMCRRSVLAVVGEWSRRYEMAADYDWWFRFARASKIAIIRSQLFSRRQSLVQDSANGRTLYETRPLPLLGLLKDTVEDPAVQGRLSEGARSAYATMWMRDGVRIGQNLLLKGERAAGEVALKGALRRVGLEPSSVTRDSAVAASLSLGLLMASKAGVGRDVARLLDLLGLYRGGRISLAEAARSFGRGGMSDVRQARGAKTAGARAPKQACGRSRCAAVELPSSPPMARPRHARATGRGPGVAAMIKRAIVIDFEPEVFRGNKILDPSWAANFPGATLFSDLAALARAQGFEVMTSDVYLSQGSVAPRASVLTDANTRYTKSLARRARMAVLFSGESPGIIPWFYYRLSEYSRAYKHALLFRGFRGGVDRRVAFHPFYWPFSRGEMRSGPSFGDRRLLVMVASHKRRYPMVPGRRLRSAAGNALRLGRWWYYQATDPTLRFTDHYETRVRAVAHFAPRPDFQLHGAGWEGAKTSLPGRPIRFAAPPTRCADKMATTSGFRFSLAFENCSYPGYVTEKIFESFLAGCVPVYCGAPDIADFCGRECFLDLADFASFEELERALRGFSEAEWNRKREAIRDFLASDLFRRHDQEALVQDLFTWLAE